MTVSASDLPPESLLTRYVASGAYADCFLTEVPRRVSHRQFVEAFYTSTVFSLERAILRLASRPSTIAEATQLAAGLRDSFAAWTVEARARDQLLLCDYLGRTRSWLMVEAIEGARPATKLYFGSAVVPKRDKATGRTSLGPVFSALLGFHKTYSRVLLSAAASRLERVQILGGKNGMLRRLRDDDLVAFQAYRQDPEVGRYQGWAATSDGDAASFLKKMAEARLFARGAWCQLAIADPASDALLGDVGLHLAEDGRCVEIGFSLARASQGRGIATAAVREAIEIAFAQSGAMQVRATTDARNAASAKLLERVGMRRTETREADFRGECCTEWVYAIERN